MKTLIRNIGQIAGIVEESVLRKNGEEMSQTGTLDYYISTYSLYICRLEKQNKIDIYDSNKIRRNIRS